MAEPKKPRAIYLVSRPMGGDWARKLQSLFEIVAIRGNAVDLLEQGSITLGEVPELPKPWHHMGILKDDDEGYHLQADGLGQRIRQVPVTADRFKVANRMLFGYTTLTDDEIKAKAAETIDDMAEDYKLYNNNCQNFAKKFGMSVTDLEEIMHAKTWDDIKK